MLIERRDNAFQQQDDLPAEGILKSAEVGGSFEFLNAPAEDIYTAQDGEPVK